MLILNGGMPRSGTTWVFNVISRILDHTGQVYEHVNAVKEEGVEQAVGEYRYGRILVVHFHELPQICMRVSQERFTRSFWNFRDPRDVVVSQMKLHQLPFEDAMKMTMSACEVFTYAVKLDRVILVPYQQIMKSPDALIFHIAVAMNVLLRQSSIDQIAEQTSLTAHRKIVEKVAKGAVETDSVETGERAIVWDRRTLLNDRHIQSGRSNRWRKELTQKQRTIANDAFKPFIDNVF